MIDDDPWKPSGSYMDRFTDRADVYVKIDGEEKSVRDGDWIVYDNFGNVIDVYSDEYVTQHFEAA